MDTNHVLKPCPFCGTTQASPEDTYRDEDVVIASDDMGRTVVACFNSKCGALGPKADDEDQDYGEREEAAAVAKWNTRKVTT